MGASGWAYFVPYQVDLYQALQAIREDVFQRGDYHRVEPYWKDLTFAAFLPPDPDLTDEDRRAYQQEYDRLQALAEPTTIPEVLLWNGTEGTHSILDIDKISPHPTMGSASPLSDLQLVHFFGTTKPTREAAIERSSQLEDYLQCIGRYRYEATYIILYEENRPSWILFTGYSGD